MEDFFIKYKHFTKRKMPFEDEIVDVVASSNVNYSDRWEFLKSINLITSKGYYLTYSDICGENAFCDPETQPYDVFLEGAIKCAYPYAFNSEIDSTLRFIKDILSKGKISVSKIERGPHVGKYSFDFTLPWYSWISSECRDN